MTFKVEVQGAGELKARLELDSKRLKSLTAEKLGLIGDKLADNMRSNAPVLTGALVSSINVVKRKGNVQVMTDTIGVTGRSYAAITEERSSRAGWVKKSLAETEGEIDNIIDNEVDKVATD